MAKFNIFSHDNGEDSEPYATITLSDDNTAVVEVSSANPEDLEDIEKSLAFYIDEGFSPVEALFHFAGSYGTVESVESDSDDRLEESSDEDN